MADSEKILLLIERLRHLADLNAFPRKTQNQRFGELLEEAAVALEETIK